MTAAKAPPRNAWVIPDRSDAVLPSEASDQLQNLYRQLRGEVSVYTLDQRGTGRSTRLACNDSSASATTSALEQLRECLESLYTQHSGVLAAFSVTSAAYDLVTLISQTQRDSDVVVYGLGYGTLVVERLLHFGVAEIKGYVLDGSMTTSGAKKNQFAYFSQADAEFGRVGDEFLSLCEKDTRCSSRFPIGGDSSKSSVSGTLKAVLKSVDASPCAALWSHNGESNRSALAANPASYKVRRALAMLMQHASERAFIPVVVYRLQRCNTQDEQVLRNLAARLAQREWELASYRELAYDLQTFSELWEDGESAPQSTMESRFAESLISPGGALDQVATYCVFAGDSVSEGCVNSDNESNRTGSRSFTYARDKYWNVGATIPAHASVLLLNGKLDGHAPLKHAELLLNALQGSAKQLLAIAAAASSTACGLEILGSYILSSGTLDKLNSSCAKQLASVSFEITEASSLRILSVTDAYDGTVGASADPHQPSSSSDSDNGSESSRPISEREISSLERSLERYRVAFIVVLTLLVLVLLIALAALYRWWKSRQLKHEETQLRQMRGDASDDLELLRQIYMSSPEAWGANEAALFSNEERKSADSDEAQKASSTSAHRSGCAAETSRRGSNDELPHACVIRSNHLQL